MALNAPRSWLIAYDISDKRRLSRVGRYIKKHAVFVQYSLYYFEGSAIRLGQIMGAIKDMVDLAKDDVRAYQLPENMQIDVFGRGSIPEAVGLLSAVAPRLQGLLAPRTAVTYDKS